ncbi:VOC family protein [Aliiroseovarius subalbicans]|uniref:VOC family protein n=1 Tax=Aliiroseovarius subalbicans TaxID=2925840 RepID=UPI001F59689D|nr:VOC family protein [Aliiroseovarius subalbicans]MCI2399702.1 VOC family protein [Aliiroseovarius subalbicans]
MQKVQGFGGFFFRTANPGLLAAWYEKHLGINPVPTDADTLPWMSEGGATVFAPFPADTDYFGDPSKQFMLNFRVADLDGMVAQLEQAGVEVEDRVAMEGIGAFARIHDPEGNPIELWQPES